MTDEKSMTLGTDYAGQDVRGWYVTEKLRDVRAFWDGFNLWTRGGRIIAAPEWFTRGLPYGVPLDGGVYAGRCQVETIARLAVQNGRWIEGTHTFQVYDAPAVVGDYPERMKVARALSSVTTHVHAVAVSTVRNLNELRRLAVRIIGEGGEGLMLRNPSVTSYEQGLTGNLLKLKTVFI